MEKAKDTSYLAEAPIGSLMIRFSIPCIMSLLIAALYNMVDQIFIGRGVGYLGNGATNVIYPITVITLALAVLIGDGCAAYLSLCQGKGDTAGAHKSVGNASMLSVIIGIVLMVLFIIFKEQILWGFGATENNISYAREYFKFIVPGIPFYMFGNAMNGIIRADGSPKFAMVSMLVGCIMNMILDPIAIFVLHWGMMGAALATIAGQIVTALLSAYYLLHTKTFRLGRESFRLCPPVLKKLVPLGGTSFMTQISIAVGVTVGAQPIIGYNYGAGNYHRVKDVFRRLMIVEICIGIAATICFEFFPIQIINIFGKGDALYEEFAALSFRIFLGTVLLCVIQKSCSIFLQALGQPVFSTALSLLREIILSVPLILFLPRVLGIVGPLFAGPISDVVSFAAAVVLIRYTFRKMGNNRKTVNV